MRANVSVGRAGLTILRQGFEQKIAEPHHAGPALYVPLKMPSEIETISPLVDQLMSLIEASHFVPGGDRGVEIALSEALANAVLHGNKKDAQKKVHISGRVHPGRDLSIVAKYEGSGFDPSEVPDATAVESVNTKSFKYSWSLEIKAEPGCSRQDLNIGGAK